MSSQLTGAPPQDKATKSVANSFVSLRGAIAYTVLTQAWIQVYVAAPQRIQEPTNLDVRRLNAITRKLQKEHKKLIFLAMECNPIIDLHSDSGYRRLNGYKDDESGYGMRGLNLIRQGKRRTKSSRVGVPNASSPDVPQDVVHLLESVCKP